MTGCQSGAVAVLKTDGTLTGIFTDGDLRRLLAKGGQVNDFSIDEAMTPNPITVRDTDLAVDILNILRTRKINDLIVLDEGDRVVGHVDIQDLPKLKIL